MRSFPESLRGFEERRIDEPRVVAKELRALFPQLPRSEQPVAMGIYASCLRQLDKTEACLVALDDALDLARRDGNVWAEANLLQRRSYVESEAGDLDSSIHTSRQALALFLESGDDDRVGTTLFDQSMNYYHLRKWHRAIQLSLAAIAYLDPANLQNIFACHTCLAASYAEVSEPEFSMASLESAKRVSVEIGSPVVAARVLWTEADILVKLSRYSQAEQLLRRVACDFLTAGMGLEAALATVELSLVLLAQGKLTEAIDAANGCRSCLVQLPEGSRAALVLASIWRRVELTRITKAFLEEAAQQLRGCGAGMTPPPINV